MNHEVNSVQVLHDDAYALYNSVVIGAGEYSADTIIGNLGNGIEILKNYWKGKDAGVQIENVVKVYNAMIGIRGTLVSLAMITSKIAADYRDVQNANGAGLEAYGTIVADNKSLMQDYVDNADTINISAEANEGKSKIDTAVASMDQFILESKKYYDSIMQNWTVGPQREEIVAKFETFISNTNRYKETLNTVSQSIRTALSNYQF